MIQSICISPHGILLGTGGISYHTIENKQFDDD